MLTDDEDRQFKPADIAELVAVVVALGLLFWLLNPLGPWLKYPAVLLGSLAVLMAWAGIKRLVRRGKEAASMAPLTLGATAPGRYSLTMTAGGTRSDGAVVELGHEPSGYFWQGVAGWILPHSTTETIRFDSEAGMFCAHGADPSTLTTVGLAMAAVVNDPARLREVVAAAAADGVVFDD